MYVKTAHLAILCYSTSTIVLILGTKGCIMSYFYLTGDIICSAHATLRARTTLSPHRKSEETRGVGACGAVHPQRTFSESV